ncbi:MAG TPA: hypothetical protein VFV34_17380, partial [Blastocatellia bacterium]|nr:hypothetical protein [Blastocatellia bacterium]
MPAPIWFLTSISAAHSCRSAPIGSTLVALRAGSQHAIKAIPISTTETAANVSGPVARRHKEGGPATGSQQTLP